MGPEARASAAQAAVAAEMQRANSGLESMQSIDDALGNVEQDIMDKVAHEWSTQHPQLPLHAKHQQGQLQPPQR